MTRCSTIIAAAALAALLVPVLAPAQTAEPTLKPAATPGQTVHTPAVKQAVGPAAGQHSGTVQTRGGASASAKPLVVILPVPVSAQITVPNAKATATPGQTAHARAPKPAAPAPKSAGARGADTVPAQPVTPAVPPVETYTYHSEGRRDPFVSLLNKGSDSRQTQHRIEGLAGLSVADATLRGILQSRGQFVAIVQGPDGKRPYIVHPNDRFADGVVRAITADSMLILQEVNDPLSLTKQREIRKTLRAVEEVK